MYNLAFSFLPWSGGPAELRIDVERPAGELERELDELQRRMGRPGDVLHGLPALGIALPGFVFRHREAGGEHYVYVEDAISGRLAGFTVFSRVPEAGRGAAACLRAPHSKYRARYQRRGIATAVYRWWLDGGRCLISGARQSSGAHALWRQLARRYPLVYAGVRDRRLRCLGRDVDARVREDLFTRMILLGQGWDLARLASRSGMRLEGEARLTTAP
ncbi:MAG: N-acetyltransferase [Pseudomonadota bacterium]